MTYDITRRQKKNHDHFNIFFKKALENVWSHTQNPQLTSHGLELNTDLCQQSKVRRSKRP